MTGPRERRRGPRKPFGSVLIVLLLAPAALLYLSLFVYPIAALLGESVWSPEGFTTHHYGRALSEPLYALILLRTLRISLVVTLVCLILGYPVAFWLTRLRGIAFSLAVGCILLPLWTSVLVRSYAWVALLQTNGLVNTALLQLGLIRAPLTLLYTETAVIIAMSHVLLPFMILPIYSVVREIPRDLSRAAQSLGARARREFTAVLLPLSVPGITAGCVMVFVLALGFFITPALLGGPRTMMISLLINQQITSVLNWSFGGALGGILLVVAATLILLFARAIAHVRRAEGGV